jgi:4'-phosphopantetheinyl transferase
MKLFWLECSAADLPAHCDWLSERETERYRSFRFPKRQADWLLGRWTAKRALATYLGSPASTSVLRQIEIRSDTAGAPKPFLDGVPAPAALSISHRGDRALAVIAPAAERIGCDLEIVEPRSDVFVRDFFTQEEVAAVEECRATDARQMATNLIWSAKESALKAIHAGLRVDTRSVSIRFGSGSVAETDWKKLRVQCVNGHIFHGWWLCSGIWIRTIVASGPAQPPISMVPRPCVALLVS